MDMNANDNSSSKNGLPYIFSRGSDPRAATCRGKLQSRRCKLNQEINKELRLRAGAENLFKATTNRKLRDTISVELSFVNSNLQLLKEQLAELNSSVEVYQNDGTKNVMPMIPLGLKETKEINFMEPFSDFILEHYSEDSTKYTDAVADITDTRQAARTPARDHQGVSLLFRYYNLLYYVERRFFPPDRNIGVYFEWYDSLTGVPSCQRTIAFEKACILFNLGSIFTQIGARQERTSEHGLDLAVDNFLRAAGIFRHIYDTFTNAPSMDLKPQVLEVFVCLMLAQARECLYEKLVLQAKTMSINNQQKDLAGEAAQLSNEYKEIHKGVQCSETQNYLPECWAGLIPLKSEYYKALAHYHTAKSIKEISSNSGDVTKHRKSSFIETLQDDYDSPSMLRAHVSEAISSYEEAQRLQRMCRFLKNKTHLTQYLNEGLKIVNEEFSEIIKQKQNKEIQDQFDLDGVNVQANTKFKLSLTGPDFSLYKVSDPFRGLGPIAIFSARRHWTAPRFVRLKKCPNVNIIIGKDKKCNCSRNSSSRSLSTYRSSIDLNQLCPDCGRHQNFNDVESPEKSSQSFGFHVKGDAPVTVSHVEQGSLADLGGIKEGDFIVEVSKVDVKWFSHQQVVGLIQESGLELEMKVVTHVDRSYLKKASLSTLSIASSSGISSDSSVATTTHKAFKPRNSNKCTKERTGTLSSGWNLFRRTNSLGKIFS